ncbi:MAG: hypothetical protein KGY54_13025 [Oleiphilaceae bacterium]|nr:hypothetical protein [Oleiphilaceae bacterium]
MLKIQIFKWLSRMGVVLAAIGSAGLILGFMGLLDFDDYSFGLSAGVRMLGSIAIAGCLMSAIGFFGLEDNGPR